MFRDKAEIPFVISRELHIISRAPNLVKSRNSLIKLANCASGNTVQRIIFICAVQKKINLERQ